jgi:hypothetical protein
MFWVLFCNSLYDFHYTGSWLGEGWKQVRIWFEFFLPAVPAQSPYGALQLFYQGKPGLDADMRL